MSILKSIEKMIQSMLKNKITKVIPTGGEKESILWHLANNMLIRKILGVDVKTPTKLLYVSNEKTLETAKNSPVFKGGNIWYMTPEKFLKANFGVNFVFYPDIVVFDNVEDHYVTEKMNDFKKVVIISSENNEVGKLPYYWGKVSFPLECSKSFERYSERGVRPKSAVENSIKDI